MFSTELMLGVSVSQKSSFLSQLCAVNALLPPLSLIAPLSCRSKNPCSCFNLKVQRNAILVLLLVDTKHLGNAPLQSVPLTPCSPSSSLSLDCHSSLPALFTSSSPCHHSYPSLLVLYHLYFHFLLVSFAILVSVTRLSLS